MSEFNKKPWEKYFDQKLEWTEGNCYLLTDDADEMRQMFFEGLVEQGVEIPAKPPVLTETEDEVLWSEERFNDIVSDALETLNLMVNYCERAFGDIAHLEAAELINEKRYEIEYHLFKSSLQFLTVSDAESLKVDMSKVRRSTNKVNREIKENLDIICSTMVAEGLPIQYDYFDLVNGDYGTIERIALGYDYKKSALDYLPLPQRILVETAQRNEALLTELHIKVDQLLPEDKHGILNDVLKLTRPKDLDLDALKDARKK